MLKSDMCLEFTMSVNVYLELLVNQILAVINNVWWVMLANNMDPDTEVIKLFHAQLNLAWNVSC